MSANWSGPLQTLSHFISTLPLLVWRADPGGAWLWASPQWQRFTGQAEADYLGDGWLNAVHPDDRATAQKAWKNARERESFEVEYRVLDIGEEDYRWFKTRASPVVDATGAILEWLGTSTDIDDVKRLREHERSLLSELQHRVRNLLGGVRSLARRTAGNSNTIEDFMMRFDGRLNAFARTQSLSTRTATGMVDLRDLVFDELLLHQMQDERRVEASGPSVMLGVRAADMLGLAVHELVSHAVVHGALTSEHGNVRIEWQIEPDTAADVLKFRWSEHSPGTRDAGNMLGYLEADFLEQTLQYELDAKTSLTVSIDTLTYQARLPMDQVQGQNT